jgi:hypothetical protein
VVTRTTGTFTGEMALPDGTVIPPTGKAFDLDFGQTSKWQGDQLIAISAFWDALRVTWSRHRSRCCGDRGGWSAVSRASTLPGHR